MTTSLQDHRLCSCLALPEPPSISLPLSRGHFGSNSQEEFWDLDSCDAEGSDLLTEEIPKHSPDRIVAPSGMLQAFFIVRTLNRTFV